VVLFLRVEIVTLCFCPWARRCLQVPSFSEPLHLTMAGCFVRAAVPAQEQSLPHQLLSQTSLGEGQEEQQSPLNAGAGL